MGALFMMMLNIVIHAPFTWNDVAVFSLGVITTPLLFLLAIIFFSD
jgi:hypothetical protein